MPLYCHHCGNALATDGMFCPVCGTLVQEFTSTLPANPSSIRREGELSCSQPAEVLESNPYNYRNPYEIIPPAPPRSRTRSGLLIAILSSLLLVVMVLGGGIAIFVFLQGRVSFMSLKIPLTQAVPTSVPTLPPACGGAFSDTFSTGQLQPGRISIPFSGLIATFPALILSKFPMGS
jgi:hypothetical protein